MASAKQVYENQEEISVVSPSQIQLEGPAQTTGQGPFTNIPLEEGRKHKTKVPRRILHFSDGTLEEYSTDEEDETDTKEPEVDPKTLRWLPWFWYYIKYTGWRTLNAADFCGEKLAWFFGITSPKYQYAIDEYERLEEEEEDERKREQREKEAAMQREAMKVMTMEGGTAIELQPMQSKPELQTQTVESTTEKY